jgi:hypothetical protein
MPITREVTVRIASVIMPTGFVKLMIQAPGAAREIACAYSTMCGIVRAAIANPAGPIVS